MASNAQIIIAREKVPDHQLQSVQAISPDQVCVVYLGGNGTVERQHNDGSVSTVRENANGNARHVRMEITEPLFGQDMGIDVPIYSVGYDFDDMDNAGTVALRSDNKKANIKSALHESKNSEGYNNYLIIDNKTNKRTLKQTLMPYLAEQGHKIDVAEIDHRARFLKIVIDGDKKTEFNFKKELYDILLDLKYSDSDIDAIHNGVEKLIRHEHTEHIDSLFHSIILPRISNDGKRLALTDALRNIRKITFVAHCYGAFVAKKLQNKMKSEMPKLGYSDKEITDVLNQMLVVAHAPSCRLDNQTNGFISFMSAFDNTALLPVNWLSKHIKDHVSDDSKVMVHDSLKYKEHTWFPKQGDINEPIAFLPQKYGNMMIVPQSFNFVIDNGMIGTDDNEHNNTGYDLRKNGETNAGYIMNKFAKNVILNGIKNSLAQSDGFIPLPDTATLLFPVASEINREIFNDMQHNGLMLVRDAYITATETLRNKMSEQIKNHKKDNYVIQ